MYRPVFASASMRNLIATCDQISASGIPILLCGETGTGKEVVARHIHENSPRCEKPMIAVNCAALPEQLVESELFGAAKGAYTDAKTDRRGLVGAANGGTLFLDELSEMPLGMQSKLLRVLQDRKVRQVGSTKEQDIDFRLICAVSRLPKELLSEKRLRPDLYYRIGAITLFLPRLRNRKDDILPLAETFLDYYAREQAIVEEVFLSEEAKAAMMAYDWPGNVRQLENEVQRVLALGYRHALPTQGFSPAIASATEEKGKGKGEELSTLEGAECAIIIQALEAHGGVILRTAEFLKIGRQTLYNKIRHFDLEKRVEEIQKANPNFRHSKRKKTRADESTRVSGATEVAKKSEQPEQGACPEPASS